MICDDCGEDLDISDIIEDVERTSKEHRHPNMDKVECPFCGYINTIEGI